MQTSEARSPAASRAGANPPTPRKTIYLDHAATSWPKPPEVLEAMLRTLSEHGANPGRGAYGMALRASLLVSEARRSCAELLGVPDPRDLLFQAGNTAGCNLMLKGLLQPGDRVVASSMEHNAIARPLQVLARRGVELVIVPADRSGLVDAGRCEDAVRAAPTRAVVCQHASNVTGAVQPIADLADIAHENGALLLVDGAQAAGHLSVDLTALDVDAYAVSGHKGMLGPQGIGLLYLKPGVDALQLVEGGTGGQSSEDQPEQRPERYEAGTPNTPGIVGLGTAARLLLEHGLSWRSEEQRLFAKLRAGLAEIGGLRLLGQEPEVPSVPIVSIVAERMEPDRVAFLLDRRFGVAVRSGLHCAPWAHRTLGTLAGGAVRFGLGYGNTDDDIEFALEALAQVLA
jgi:cysteine desulfurase family protein